MSRVEVKSKLRRIIREMLLSDFETEKEIPERIVKYMLENYGCVVSEKSDEGEDLNTFVKHLQEWIERLHHLEDEPIATKTDESDFDLNSVFEKYLEAETEYSEVTAELSSTLEEMVKHKEKYSLHFRNRCKEQETKVQVLNKKCLCVELNSLFQLYKEGNALTGHLALREKLKDELSVLKKNLKEIMEYNKNMSEIKNDKTFIELFQHYSELKKIEERAEIIAQL